MATTYQDVVRANLPADGWALPEAAGLDFAPWVGAVHLAGTATLLYQQPGPFAASEAVHLAAGAGLRTPTFTSPLFPPVTIEQWLKLDVFPPTANTVVMYAGNASLNGWGIVIKTDGTIRYLQSGQGFYDTNVPWPDGNWHLLQMGGLDSTGTSVQLTIDGVQVWLGRPAAGLGATPNQIGFGCDSSAGANRAMSIAYPALYLHTLSAEQLYASFLAATDPATALAYTLGSAAASNALLQQIISAVTYRGY